MARHVTFRQPERLRRGRGGRFDCVEPQVPDRGRRVAAELRFGSHPQIRFAKNRAAIMLNASSVIGRTYAAMARPALRRANVDEEPRLNFDRRADTGARHWREYGDVQPD